MTQSPFSEKSLLAALLRIAERHPEQFSCNDPDAPQFMAERKPMLLNHESLISRRLKDEVMSQWPDSGGSYAWLFESQVGELQTPL